MHTQQPTPRFGMISGVVGMLGVLVVLRLLELITDVKPLTESLADGILLILPVDVFGWLRSTLGVQAKTWLYIGITLGFLLLGAGLGAWVSSAGTRLLARVYQAAAGLFVLAVVLFFLVDRRQLEGAFILTIISLAAAAVVFAWITYSLLRPATDSTDPTRRAAIGTFIGAVGVLVLGRDTWQLWRQQSSPTSLASADAHTPAITPIDEFYRVSKNFVDPENDRGPNWSIEVTGQVEQPGEWSYQQLADLGYDHSISTMLCISNQVGGDLIGTAEWSGIPLATALDAMGANGDYVYFYGADDYKTSVPMDRCRHEQAFLVWGMNGEPLPEKNGAPVRAIIPGLYGMKSVKWLTRMDVTDENKLGYWEERDWTNTALVKPMSRIDFPRRSDTLEEGTIPVRGIAFGGDVGVSAVEVSTDNGESWQEARITEEPNPNGVAWSLWQYDWSAEPGTHTLVVRMIGQDGSVQTEESASPLPDGASGWHSVDVYVNRS